ncbi:MAG TPA: hypothetical protein VH437_17815 [Terriglobales bacterium]
MKRRLGRNNTRPAALAILLIAPYMWAEIHCTSCTRPAWILESATNAFQNQEQCCPRDNAEFHLCEPTQEHASCIQFEAIEGLSFKAEDRVLEAQFDLPVSPFDTSLHLSPPAGLLSSGGEGVGSEPPVTPAVKAPVVREEPSQNIQWRPLARQSLFYLGVMHAFRIGTEPSTRKALGNSVFGGYFEALGAMHGWSDGDGYYENYLGHPFQGGVSGYLWVHNDPRYRNVEFGTSRDYWMSRLRAYAYSWAFSEQFEIGLLSEASIGQIQRYCCGYGFVDHVVTPNGGLLWMLGGDAVDKYVIRRIEDRTRNVHIRAVARMALDPPLTFANLLAGQAPWHRENRPGVYLYDGELFLRQDEPAPEIRLVPKLEVTAQVPTITHFRDLPCRGGGGVGGLRMNDSWQWTLEVGGCTFGDYEPNWSGDSLTFTTGPQWILHNASRWSPHFATRFGGHKVTQEYVDPVLQKKVLASVPPDKDPNDYRYDYTTHYESTGFALSISGGLDVRMTPALALRVANVDYLRSWAGPVNGYDFSQGLRVSTGLVLRIGTW